MKIILCLLGLVASAAISANASRVALRDNDDALSVINSTSSTFAVVELRNLNAVPVCFQKLLKPSNSKKDGWKITLAVVGIAADFIPFGKGIQTGFKYFFKFEKLVDTLDGGQKGNPYGCIQELVDSAIKGALYTVYSQQLQQLWTEYNDAASSQTDQLEALKINGDAVTAEELRTYRARFDVVGGKVRSLASYYQIGTCSGVECKDDNVQRDALTQFGLFIQLQYSSWYKQQYTLYEHLYDLSFQSSIIYRKQIMSLLRSDYEKFVPKVWNDWFQTTLYERLLKIYRAKNYDCHWSYGPNAGYFCGIDIHDGFYGLILSSSGKCLHQCEKFENKAIKYEEMLMERARGTYSMLLKAQSNGQIWAGAMPNTPYVIKKRVAWRSFGCFSRDPKCDKTSGIPFPIASKVQQEYPKITRIQICDGASIDYMRVEYDGGDVSEAGNRNGGSCSYIFSSIRNLSEIRITELHYHANSPARLDDAQTDRGESVLYLDDMDGLGISQDTGPDPYVANYGSMQGHAISDKFSRAGGNIWACAIKVHGNSNKVTGLAVTWCFYEHYLAVESCPATLPGNMVLSGYVPQSSFAALKATSDANCQESTNLLTTQYYCNNTASCKSFVYGPVYSELEDPTIKLPKVCEPEHDICAPGSAPFNPNESCLSTESLASIVTTDLQPSGTPSYCVYAKAS